MREYNLKLFVGGAVVVDENHHTLKPIKKRIRTILENMNLEMFYDKGEFIETHNMLHDTYHIKRFRIKIDIPDMEILIRKKTTGDINQLLFLEEWHL